MADHIPAMRLAAAEARDLLLRWHLTMLRMEAGLTVAEIAALCGVKPHTIEDFESPNGDPHLSSVRRYALAVGAMIRQQVTPEIADPDTTTEEEN